ncbi:hypothetical protein P7C71_g2660, partial [Lecanoromycetidae sp. Uapishka_2]
MNLTPIRIRGKKRSAQPAAAPRGKRHLGLNGPTQNFPSDPSPKTPPLDATRRVQGTLLRPVSALERLPVELLENIFLLCLNIALPQASPTIGQALASKHVKSQLVFRVLSSADTFGYPRTLRIFVSTLKNQAELQSAILRTKWMTLPFLQSLIPEYIVTTLIRELSQRSLSWLGKKPVSGESGPMIHEYLKLPCFNRRGVSGLPGSAEVAWLANDEANVIHLSISLHDGLITLRILGPSKKNNRKWDTELSCSMWRILGAAEGCQIPEKLLHGPWTDEKCEFLEVLVRADAEVDWVGSTSGEVAERGLQDAIREHNPRAIRALLARRPKHHDTQATDSYPSIRLSHLYTDLLVRLSNPVFAEDRVSYQSPRRGVGLVPSQSHVRMAIIDEGCLEDVVEALTSGIEDDFITNDHAIQEWIIRSAKGSSEEQEAAKRAMRFIENM